MRYHQQHKKLLNILPKTLFSFFGSSDFNYALINGTDILYLNLSKLH